MEKIIITGTGRSGTTFLVHLLTAMGYNTGFDINNIAPHMNPSNGGLETGDLKAHIVKNCNFCFELPKYSQQWDIKHVFVCVRELYRTVKSREKHGTAGGGFWKAGDKWQQKTVHLEATTQLIYDLSHLDIPFTLINFNKMMNDSWYLFGQLHEATFFRTNNEQFKETYNKILDKSKITC